MLRHHVVSLSSIAALAIACADPDTGATAAAVAVSPFDATGCAGPGCEGGLTDGEFDYVVVGAGAGGGPLAANLARRGHRVLLLEAGRDPGHRLTYQIPAWHALASEDPAMRWDYYVDHYDDPAQAARDDKLVRDADGNPRGVWYPRGSGLGGSTAINAMITVKPHDSDWDRIADLVGGEDPGGSWRPAAMARYFARAERNGYLPEGVGGHGYDGWMDTATHPDDLADYLLGAADLKMLRVIAAAVLTAADSLGRSLGFLRLPDLGQVIGYVAGDLNAGDPGRDGREGAFRIPQQTRDGARRSTREFILDTVAEGYPLTVKTRALVTRVTFDDGDAPRATGVEWLDGVDLYAASPRSRDDDDGQARSITANREVVLSAGAFNTPQLLMLSGVGPRAELERHGIDVVADRPGVGANLQDRYEVGVVGETSSWFGDQFRLLKDCGFDARASRNALEKSDPCYVLWQSGAGVYTSNGSAVGIVKRSRPDLADPDLFIFGIAGYFRGYWPGYSEQVTRERRHFTWVVLKAHTANNRGTVTLASADPRARPDIDFRYFSSAGGQRDLDALVEGVRFARSIVERTRDLTPFTGDFREVYPGPAVSSDADIAQHIRDKSWGHHACCTARIGPAGDELAVLDADFRVRGVRGLRVVDASVFPTIPGFFLTVPIYMVSEKAADVIDADAR